MGRTCDVCGKELSVLNKFRYEEGFICKECYAKASRQFTETIRSKTLAEIKALCSVQRDEESFENFRVTGKIGNYLLVDARNYRVCIPSNRMTNRTVTEPVFYDIADIEECRLICEPDMPREELEQMVKEQKSEKTVSRLCVVFCLKNGKRERITIVKNPLRVKSFAFRRSFHFAGRICDEMHRLMKEQNDQEGKKEYEAI